MAAITTGQLCAFLTAVVIFIPLEYLYIRGMRFFTVFYDSVWRRIMAKTLFSLLFVLTFMLVAAI